ncbi:adipocyte plasma membrane-associated protein-like [Clavelina lepadiformis]|uniref:adipocyte plasma membrane-associated protein-like n=1 Tax=Clavelina lepadiformis TaxID=159417 RepID=UPI0040438E47
MSASVRRRKPENKSNAKIGIEQPKNNKDKSDEQHCCFKCFSALLSTLAVLTTIGLLGYYQAPFTAVPLENYSVQVKLVGLFSPNNKLSEATRITGLSGPECILEDDKGNLYTGLADGRIVQIRPSSKGYIGAGDIVNVTSGFIKNIPRAMEHVNHGRPLGLRRQGQILYVADANYGIYAVNIRSGKVDILVAVNDVNPPLALTDDLCVSKNGKFIYFSDMTSSYKLDRLIYANLEGLCKSRVFQYNTESKTVRVVTSSLCFGNGVQLSEDEKLLFVAEPTSYRVRIIDMMTWKTLRFVDVPIMPDNIRSTGQGTYWIAGSSLWTSSYGFLERNPVVRQIIAGLFSYKNLERTIPKYSMVLEMTEEGEILQSLHDPTGDSISALTHAVTLSDGRLALGSFKDDFIAILNEKNLAIGLA